MRSLSNGWTEVPSADGRSVFDFDKTALAEALRAQRERTMELLRAIPEADWERTVVPRWRLREVVAHLITTDEGSLTGRTLVLGLKSDANAAISKLEVWNDKQVPRYAERPIPDLLQALEKWARRLERLVRVVPRAIGRPFVPSPYGKVPLLYLVSLRVYDEWVHLEDVRRAYERPSDDALASIRPVAEQLFAGLPLQSGSRVREDARGRVAMTLEDAAAVALGFDLGGKRFGFGVTGDDASVIGSTATVAMIAARRDAWREVEAAGGLKIEGDRAAAEALLDALQLV